MGSLNPFVSQVNYYYSEWTHRGNGFRSLNPFVSQVNYYFWQMSTNSPKTGNVSIPS